MVTSKFLQGISPIVKQLVKTIFFYLLLNVAASLRSLAQTNIWVQKNNFACDDTLDLPEPITRDGAVGFSIGNKGYIGTGLLGPTYIKDFWEYDPAVNAWTQKADFGGTPRFGAVGFSIGTKGYIGTGSDGFSSYKKDFWEYDPVANAWTQKADFEGKARSGAAGFSIASKGYIGTGGFSMKDFWEYDPITNIWTQKADFGGKARHNAVGFSIGRKGYLGTGTSNTSSEKDFWQYDPLSNTWTRKADFDGTARYDAVGFSIGSKGYIGTGYAFDGYAYDYYSKDFFEYDPSADLWVQKSDFEGTARSRAVGFSIGSKGYIGTGASFNGYNQDYKDFWQYDTAENAWIQKADFGGKARTSAAGFNIGGKGYIGTGYSYTGSDKDFWQYDLTANTWTQKADFGGSKRGGAVGLSIGNKGYIGTGAASDVYKDFWEYDPAANVWTQKTDFGGIARSGAVGFSSGGKGYIGTGYQYDRNTYSNIYYKDFWEYDPVANAWTQKADFGGTARRGAVGFSIGSKGYIGTGDGDNGDIKDFWEYDPVANGWTQKADFGGTSRSGAVGFSIGSKGYIGTGYNGYSYYCKDFWEFDPVTNVWAQKADFAGTARSYAAGFSASGKGYIGTGSDYSKGNRKDFWEYTPDGCPLPANLRVPKISDTCARVNWNIPDVSVEHIKVSYRAVGDTVWIEDRKKSLENSKVICGLTPNTTYEWKLRNICADDKTGWVKGPDFTTTSSAAFSSDAITGNGDKVHDHSAVQVMPNPNKGSFTLQIQLPAKAVSTTLALYNNHGEKIWQQHAGRLSGSVNISIALESKLPAGIYVLMIQHGSTRLMQKVVVVK